MIHPKSKENKQQQQQHQQQKQHAEKVKEKEIKKKIERMNKRCSHDTHYPWVICFRFQNNNNKKRHQEKKINQFQCTIAEKRMLHSYWQCKRYLSRSTMNMNRLLNAYLEFGQLTSNDFISHLVITDSFWHYYIFIMSLGSQQRSF